MAFNGRATSQNLDFANLDSIVNQYIRKWLEVPISGTLSNVYLTTNKFSLNVFPPSTKFVQCQTTIRNNNNKIKNTSENQRIITLTSSMINTSPQRTS